MNAAELVASLTPEQNLALLAVRDELMSANAAQNAELGAAHASLIADKDSEIVRLQAMMERDRADAAKALEALRATHAEEIEKAKVSSDDACRKLSYLDVIAKTEGKVVELQKLNTQNAEDAKDSIAMLELQLAQVKGERDEALKGAQAMRDGLAQLGNAQRSRLEAARDAITDSLGYNNRALAADDERRIAAEKAEREKLIAQKQSEIDALKK